MPEQPSTRPTPADTPARPPAVTDVTDVTDVAPRGSNRSPLDLHSPADWLRWIGRSTKRIAVLVLGVAIVGAGLAMIVLPGPGVLVIVVGLAVLATEFAWAERALDRTTAKAATAASKVSSTRSGRMALAASGIGMVVGGATVVALVGTYRVVGASIAVAGLIGLATMHPRVQRWIDARATAPATPAGPGSPDLLDTSGHPSAGRSAGPSVRHPDRALAPAPTLAVAPAPLPVPPPRPAHTTGQNGDLP